MRMRAHTCDIYVSICADETRGIQYRIQRSRCYGFIFIFTGLYRSNAVDNSMTCIYILRRKKKQCINVGDLKTYDYFTHFGRLRHITHAQNPSNGCGLEKAS